jgi:predicted alpha/beta superfamily hydrolase
MSTAHALSSSLPAATLPQTLQFDFTSALNGLAYRVRVARPFVPPPPAGYPVLFVLDGDGFFGSFAEAARLRALGREIEPAVVVGIGYPDDDIFVTMNRRNLDLTFSDMSSAGLEAGKAALQPGTEFGGGEVFQRIIETEIQPQVAALVPVDAARQVLWGHSLAGYFALATLFGRPDWFQTVVASDPSIFWDGRSVLKLEPEFSQGVVDRRYAPRVMITYMGKGQTPYRAIPGATDEQLAVVNARVASWRGIDAVIELGTRLSALQGAPGYCCRWHVYPDCDHEGVVFRGLNDFLDFALPPTIPPPR